MSEQTAKTKRGIVWMLFSGAGAQVVIAVTNLAMFRFVDRAVLGEAMNAADVVLLAYTFSGLGLGQFMVVKTRNRPDLAFHATVLFLSVGLLSLSAVLLFPETIGRWFKSYELAKYVPGLVLAAMVDRVGMLPERILIREQQFRPVALTRGLGEVIYGVTSLLLASFQFGGYAVVYGNICRSIVRTAMFVKSAPRRAWLDPCRLEWSKMREVLSFGLPLSVAASALMASRKTDNLLVSRFFGPAVSQEYRTAYNYAETPGGIVTDQAVDVLLSSFVNEKPETRGASFVRSVSLLALLCTPALIGLAVVAPTFTHTLLPSKWGGVAPLLAALSVGFVTKPVSAITVALLQANARTKTVTLLETINAVVILGAVGVLGRFSPLLACVAIGFAALLRMLFGIWLVHRESPLPLGSFFVGQLVPIVASLPMVAAVLGVRRLWPFESFHMLIVRLGVEIVLGALAFLVTMFLLFPARTKEAVQLLKGLRRRD